MSENGGRDEDRGMRVAIEYLRMMMAALPIEFLVTDFLELYRASRPQAQFTLRSMVHEIIKGGSRDEGERILARNSYSLGVLQGIFMRDAAVLDPEFENAILRTKQGDAH